MTFAAGLEVAGRRKIWRSMCLGNNEILMYNEDIDDLRYERNRLQDKVYDLERDVEYYSQQSGYVSEEEWLAICDENDELRKFIRDMLWECRGASALLTALTEKLEKICSEKDIDVNSIEEEGEQDDKRNG